MGFRRLNSPRPERGQWLDRKALALHLWEAVTEGEFREAVPLTWEPAGLQFKPLSTCSKSLRQGAHGQVPPMLWKQKSGCFLGWQPN